MTFFNISIAVKLISAAITALIGIYACVNRHQRGARFLAWVMLFETLNAFGSIFESVSVSLTNKLWWFNFHQTAHIFSIPFFLFFILDYVGEDRLLKRRIFRPVLLYFIFWAALLWTDSRHHLLRYDMMLRDGELTFSSTGLSLFLNIIGFMALFVALCYLAVYAGKHGSLARKQTLWVWLSAIMPIAWILAGFANPLPPLLWGMYTVVINGFIGICLFMAVFRYKLLATVPIAKDLLVEMMVDGVLVTNETGTVIDSNAAARRFFASHAGLSEDLAGKKVSQLLAPWPEWLHACDSREPGELEIEIGEDPVNGSYKVYKIKSFPVFSASKRRLGTVWTMTDHTEEHRRLRQMEQLNRLKDELFAIVSHDIRAPLAIFLNLTDILEEERTRFSEDSREVLDAVKEKAKSTYAMVENLLEWVRSQKDGIALHASPHDLSSIVEETIHQLESRSAAKQVSIRNEVADGVQVRADREAVRLILRNLLSNTIKYTASGGLVRIHTEERDETVLVTVRDNGIGMDPERMKMLFGDRPLASLPGTDGETGTGIGLLVCKELLQRSGGTIGVHSIPGEGSAFFFSLPRAIA